MNPEQVIDFRNREKARQDNVRSLWQDTSTYVYPYVNITTTTEPGTPRTKEIYDLTPMLDAEDMVSNLKHILFPAGQMFFAIKVGNGSKVQDNIQRYISMLTEVAHDQIFNSNFIVELDEVLRSLIIFGPASIYSEWTPKTGLNYRNTVIGTYQFIENSKKLVDGIVITVSYTPAQAIEEFGDNVGEEVTKASKDPKKSNDKFEFIYLIAPRKIVNPTRSKNVSDNMPWEEIIVNVKEKKEVYKGGYRQFPYHSARWKRPANEKHGRGVGTEILPQIKMVDKMKEDFIDEIGKRRTTTFKVTKIPVWALREFKAYCQEECGNVYSVGIIQLMKTKKQHEEVLSLFHSLKKEVEELRSKTFSPKLIKTFGGEHE